MDIWWRFCFFLFVVAILVIVVILLLLLSFAVVFAIIVTISSGKQSDPGHFSKSQGKFFLSFLCTLLFIFLRPKKLQIETLNSFLGRFVFHYILFPIFTLFEPFFLVKKK